MHSREPKHHDTNNQYQNNFIIFILSTRRMFLDFKDMVNEVDTDGTGSIDLPEFLSMMAIRINDQNTEDDLREAFELFDHVSHKISRQSVVLMII